jgi:hypothetical protein
LDHSFKREFGAKESKKNVEVRGLVVSVTTSALGNLVHQFFDEDAPIRPWLGSPQPISPLCIEENKRMCPAFIEERLQLDAWDDKQSGQKRTKLRVVAESLQLLGKNPRRRIRPHQTAPPATPLLLRPQDSPQHT